LRVCFEIIRHVLAKTNINAAIGCVLEDNVVDFASMSIEFLAKRDFFIPVLRCDVGAVPVAEDNTFAFVVNWVQPGFDTFPPLEDAARVRGKADDVAKRLKSGRLVE
jgi:hypothetical protein